MEPSRPREPPGGLDVPDQPVAPVECWYSDDSWRNPNYGLMDPSAFKSAQKAQVFEWARKGPRGGQFWAVRSEEAWLAWVTVYKARVLTRMTRAAARRLGYDSRKRRPR